MIGKIKEWKEEISKKVRRKEKLYKWVRIGKENVILRKNNEPEFKPFLFCFALPFMLFSLIFLILIFYELTSNRINIIALIFYSCFIFPFYIVVVLGFQDFFWNKETEWNIDFRTQNIIFSRIRPYLKQLKEFNFSQVKYLLYEGSWDCYIISFHLGRFKNPIFFAGTERECVLLGKILSNRIQRNFYYRSNRFGKKSFVFYEFRNDKFTKYKYTRYKFTNNGRIKLKR